MGLHLLNGLYDAKMDGQPVLAITGHHFHDLIDTQAQQDAVAARTRCRSGAPATPQPRSRS